MFRLRDMLRVMPMVMPAVVCRPRCAFGRVKWLRGVFALALVPCLAPCLGGCSELAPVEKEEAKPQSWQLHLKEVKLPEDFKPVCSESIYVPVYSTIYYENKGRTLELTATVSVRNTDLKNRIVLRAVDYYGTDGKLLKSYLTEPVEVLPMSAADFVIARTDVSGGTGANFVVNWVSEAKVSPPLAEAVMVSTGSSQSISFVSRGQTIKVNP